jgi:hypothetical protein
MAFIKTVTRYSAFLYPNGDQQSGRINLYCGDHRLYLLFVDPSDPMPENTYNEASKIGVAYQRFGQFEHFLDLIRNEKPISVTFRPEVSPTIYVVYCASESPGDGEI